MIAHSLFVYPNNGRWINNDRGIFSFQVFIYIPSNNYYEQLRIIFTIKKWTDKSVTGKNEIWPTVLNRDAWTTRVFGAYFVIGPLQNDVVLPRCFIYLPFLASLKHAEVTAHSLQEYINSHECLYSFNVAYLWFASFFQLFLCDSCKTRSFFPALFLFV